MFKQSFECSRCSLCCRVPEALKELGLPIKEDGSCGNLQPDNSCGIYDTRPDGCRIDRLYTLQGFHHIMSEGEYLSRCAVACNGLMDTAGAPSELRLDPTIYQIGENK